MKKLLTTIAVATGIAYISSVGLADDTRPRAMHVLGYSMQSLQQANAAVVLVDAQETYYTKCRDDEKKEIENITSVLMRAYMRDVPIIVLKNDEGGSLVSDISDVLSTFKRKPIELPKAYPNGFANTGLDETLHDLNVKNVILMGMYASNCVKATARGAISFGFNPITSYDVILNPEEITPEEMHDVDRWYIENVTLARDHQVLGQYLMHFGRLER